MIRFETGENFKDIGEKIKLDEETLKIYVWYMESRWKDKEQQMCKDGYAGEWAFRFLRKIEFSSSDIKGMRLLFSTGKYDNMSEEIKLQENAYEALRNEGFPI